VREKQKDLVPADNGQIILPNYMYM